MHSLTRQLDNLKMTQPRKLHTNKKRDNRAILQNPQIVFVLENYDTAPQFIRRSDSNAAKKHINFKSD